MQSEPEIDEYFKRALIEGYRARSAFKLLQIDKSFNLLKDAKNVIDLCSAPGSWSQVISNKLHNIKNNTLKDKIHLQPNIKIASVDLASIKPIPGVTSLVGDITDIKTCEKLLEIFENERVDVIVCDGAHDVSGLVQADFQLHLNLITACIHIILQMLKEKGSFVAKIFDTWGCQIFLSQFRVLFKEVYVVKPHSSRSESYECFVVCKQYKSIKDFDPSKLTPYLDCSYRDFSKLTGIHKLYIPFFVLGHVDIEKAEFDELYKQYGDDLNEKYDLLETAFREDDLAGLNLDKQDENEDSHEQFFKHNLLNRSKVTFGISRKLFITYLNENCTIDFYKSISFGEKSYIDIENVEDQQSKLNKKDNLDKKLSKGEKLNLEEECKPKSEESNLELFKNSEYKLVQEEATLRNNESNLKQGENTEFLVKLFKDLALKDDGERIKKLAFKLDSIISKNDKKESLPKEETKSKNLQKENTSSKIEEINLEKLERDFENIKLNLEEEESTIDEEEYLSKKVHDHEFVVKLFNEFIENDETNKLRKLENKDNKHPWLSERNLQENEESFEDFKLESVVKKADDEVMKAIRETNDSLPKEHELSHKVSLLINPNDEILKLVEERKSLLEEIQKIVNN